MGAVLARPREGEGRRESLRAGVFAPDVRVRFSMPDPRTTDSMLALGSSFQDGRIGVAVVPTVEPENLLSWAPALSTLCTLDRLEPDPTGFLGMLYDEEFEKYGFSAASSPRTRAGAGMLSGDGLADQSSPLSKSGSGDSRPLPS